MELSKTTWWMIGGAGVAVLGIGAFWFLNKRLEQKKPSKGSNSILGTGKSINLQNKAVTRQVPNWNNSFDMNYTKEVTSWLAPKTIVEMDVAIAEDYAMSIKNAKGMFNDNEESVRIIFSKQLQDKTNVSSISRAFWNTYKEDMWQYLTSFLSQSEMNQYIIQPVKQLPNYTITQ